MAAVTLRMGEARDATAESRLLERAIAGDRDAFDGLVRVHFAEVYGLIHRLVAAPEEE